ncbi:Josephin-domain-containing protein [Dentipellis sp. KUC8613]|nr:Josephin-domain-containing protein [Dentipellis sp. KUC8613]
MAGLEGLIPLIYHEKQEAGSMLCAQHALNSLLQGNYFTTPDLSEIARSLDTLEGSYREEDAERTSTNMDDTGFFSVQVLENALNVWGLSLVRWRSEEMRPYQNRPHTQLAFILNLNQHWFTLRRFGDATPQIDLDQGNGHWFNLNSFLDAPEWVSKTYLGMVLQQAETEGYSVFAVTQSNPDAPLALPRTQADEVAATLPDPAGGRSAQLSTSRTPRAPSGLEDEDLELQAALQASLSADPQAAWAQVQAQWGESSGSGASTSTSGFRGSGSSSRADVPHNRGLSNPTLPQVPFAPLGPSSSGNLLPPLADNPEDPVAAGVARNRALLERMQREQEAALRESYEEEIARFGTGAGTSAGPVQAGPSAEDDEDEQLRRAIAESEALARGDQAHAGGRDDELLDDDGMDLDAPHQGPVQTHAYAQPEHRWPAPGDRVYDDDDAELQAALRASLEDVPPEFRIPDTPPPARPEPPSAPAPAAPSSALSAETESDRTSNAETETEGEAEAEPQEEQVSVEEMRRRRLARFGGS